MEKNQDKKYLFEQMPIPRAYTMMCIPVVLSSLVTVLYGMADTYFVSMLNNPIQNAAVTLVSPIMLAFNAVNNLFGAGTSSAMSRYLGAGQEEKVRITSAFGFYGALISGILFSLLSILLQDPMLRALGADETTMEATVSYMRWTVCAGAAPAILNVVQSNMVKSEGCAFHASIGTMSGCVLNMILDPIFILPWGLNMGAAGAGLATFLSNTVACLYFVVLAFSKGEKTYVCMNPRKLQNLSREIVGKVTGVGIPASIQNLVNVLSAAILSNFTAAFGPAAVAAMGIAHKLQTMIFQTMMGAGQGIMPLVSYNYTSGDRNRMKKCILFAARVTVPISTSISILYWFCSRQIIHFFIENAEIVTLGGDLLQSMAFCIPCLCLDFLAVGVFQALGKGRYALIYAIMRKIVMEIPLLYLLNRLWPLYGIPYAQVISEFVLAVTSVVMLRRIFKNSPQIRRQEA